MLPNRQHHLINDYIKRLYHTPSRKDAREKWLYDTDKFRFWQLFFLQIY